MSDNIINYINEKLIVQYVPQDEQFHGAIDLTLDFCAFRGHFPDNPVLPGVVYLMIAQRFVESVVHEKLIIISASKNKFFYMLQPPAQLFMKGDITHTEMGISAKILFYTASEPRVAVILLKLKKESVLK